MSTVPSNIAVFDPSVKPPALPPRETLLVSYLQSKDPFVAAHFILDCARRLDLDCVVAATACSLFHAFGKNQNKDSKDVYDQYLIATACMYLAGKLECPDQLKVRDLVNVTQRVLHGPNSEPLSMDGDFYNVRDSICQTELLVLRFVGFRARRQLPHAHLLHYLRSLKQWMSADVWEKYPIAKTSWSMLQDSFHDSRVIDLDCACLAAACISMALQSFGIEVPYVNPDGRQWYEALSSTITRETLNECQSVLMDVYNKENVLIEPLTRKCAL